MVNSQVFLADDDYKQSALGNILVRDWYLYVVADSSLSLSPPLLQTPLPTTLRP
jgi:hypothetical protein